MEATFYAYTIFVMLVCATASTASLLSYVVTRNRMHAYISVAFLLYFFDLSCIFQMEYLNHGRYLSIDDFYIIDDPVIKILLSAAILEALWLAICVYLSEKRTQHIVLPVVVFLAVELIIVCAMNESPIKQWLFYTMRELFLFFILAYIAVRYRTLSEDASVKTRIKRLRKLLYAAAIIVGCIVAENTFLILLWRPSDDVMTSLLPLYLAERNFSENVLVILLAILTFRHAFKTFQVRHKQPPTPDRSEQAQYIEDILGLYCDEHALTRRERDILLRIVEGKDYQNTASELHLAIGTVKSHTHNILKKTGTKTRQELIQNFWEN